MKKGSDFKQVKPLLFLTYTVNRIVSDYHRKTYATTLYSLELAGLYEYLQITN